MRHYSRSTWSYITGARQAQYLKFPSNLSPVYPSQRLNTHFAKQLMVQADQGIDEVFAHEIQTMKEPQLDADLAETADAVLVAENGFNGANGLYFWELFFHTPFLVAFLLVQEGRFEEARKWLHYIFVPSALAGEQWQFKPIRDAQSHSREQLPAPPSEGVPDPDQIAVASPVRYAKAVYFLYVNSLIGQGDACYRELSRDGINEAMQWYMQALALLGRRPRNLNAKRWRPMPLAEAYKQQQEKVNKQAPTGMFSLPVNPALLEFWTRLETRLHNLRHGLTIDGKPLSLPLFDPPADPAALSRLRAFGRDGAGRDAAQRTSDYPAYRFAVLLVRAYAAADTLIQTGNALQLALERKDVAHLETLQQTQMLDLQKLTVGIQQQTIVAAGASLGSLTEARDAATRRHDYYDRLVKENISALEAEAARERIVGASMNSASHAVRMIGGVADLAPNIFGTSDGGMRYGALAYATADGLLTIGEATTQSGYLKETMAQYQRRLDEWTQQRTQAESDRNQLNYQIASQTAQAQLYRRQLDQIKQQQLQQHASWEFMSSRFSSEDLYAWMGAQLSELYAQAYDATVSVCQLAELAWRFETGKFDAPSFIVPGLWSDRRAGLLKGERLKLCLQQMDTAYLKANDRKLEIIHTVSLCDHLKDSQAGTGAEAGADAICRTWSSFKTRIDGLIPPNDSETPLVLAFRFKKADFDLRYPDHILRRIVAVTVTLPGIVGPYQDICATLRQNGSSIEYEENNSKQDLRSHQQVALSTGLDDSGSFMLNFGDERFLPFEGTGANDSDWELSFPNPGRQAEFLKSLTDVVVRIRYTARPGVATS